MLFWNSQALNINKNWLCKAVEFKLKHQFLQTWFSQIQNSSKAVLYRIYEVDFGLEKYLKILPFNLRYIFAKFRTSTYLLPIEKAEVG